MTVCAAISPETATLAEIELIRRVQAGEARAFSQLASHWLPILYPFVLRMTENAEQAEDLCQETFIRAYRGLRRFDARRRFKPWLFRIAVNTVRSAYRAKRPNVVPLDEALTDADPAGSDELQALETRLCAETALNALARLDMRYRQVLWLRYREELSYEEIADVMEIPLNTVRTWIRRGLDALRREVAGALAP